MRLLLALLVLVLTLSPVPAFAAAAAATPTVKEANATLLGLLRKQAAPGSEEEKRLAAEVTRKLRGFLDVEELGRRALSAHWDKLDAAQRAEYTNLLRELVEANYVRALRSQIDYEVRYLDEKPGDAGVRVGTEVRPQSAKGKERPIRIDYVLHKSGDVYRVYDLVTDGVGLIENYRSQFNQIIAREGVKGLLDRMRKKKAAVR